MPGWRQKQKWHENERKRNREGGLEQGQSYLSQKLLHLWGLGKISASAMQELAWAAQADGCEEEELAEIAALGCEGKFPANTHRDLVKLLQRKIARGHLGGLKQSPKFCIKVPALDSKEDNADTEADFHFFLPHLWISSLFESYPKVADNLFGINSVGQFWEQVKDSDPRLIGSPVAWEKAKKAATWAKMKQKTVPLWLHGDGVEFSTDSLMVYSFGGSLCQPTTKKHQGRALKQSQNTEFHQSGLEQSHSSHSGLKQSHAMDHSLCLAAWPKSAQRQGTWDEVYEVLAWSFQSLWTGKHPDKDWKGRELPKDLQGLATKPITRQGYRFYVWQYLGDLEYFANVLKFPHWQSDAFCWLCSCNKKIKGKSPWDWRDEPGWTLASGLEQSHEGLEQSPSTHILVNAIPGGLARFRPCIDVLHTIDLGLACRIAGSVLHAWCFPPGSRAADGDKHLQKIWHQIREAYQDLGISERFTNIVLSMVVSDPKHPFRKPPILKGKAGEIRHLIPALSKVAWNKASASTAHAHMAECLHGLACFYDVLSTGDFFLQPEEAANALKFMQKTLRHATWLQEHYNDQQRFRFTPKFHFALHLAQWCKWENPRMTWTYRCESFVGSMALLAHSISHGTRATRITNSFCQKYLLAYQLRINQLEA